MRRWVAKYLKIRAVRCDIFCRVVDNFGDIGVTWRLARQLADEYGWQIRLYVDDLASFQRIAPEIDPTKPQQRRASSDIFAWNAPPIGEFGDVVIEMFGCGLEDESIAAMAAQSRVPIWINLEYLSAEAWVAENHLLPSRHPQHAITSTFFFPGFDEGTGGLIRERSVASPLTPAGATELRVFLFGYDTPAMAALAQALDASADVTSVSVPEGALAARVCPPALAKLVQSSFVPQPLFDALLHQHDVLFVRGEDSFVRAQFAGKPFIWQIYPQSDRAHEAKLEAFLTRYCRGLSKPAEQALRGLWYGVNNVDSPEFPASVPIDSRWEAFQRQLPGLAEHAIGWANSLMARRDLAANLVAWVEKSAKNP